MSLLRDGDGRAAICRASTKAGESGEQVVSAGVTTLGSKCRGGVLYSKSTFPVARPAEDFLGVGVDDDDGDIDGAARSSSVSSNG